MRQELLEGWQQHAGRAPSLPDRSIPDTLDVFEQCLLKCLAAGALPALPDALEVGDEGGGGAVVDGGASPLQQQQLVKRLGSQRASWAGVRGCRRARPSGASTALKARST